MKEVLYVMRIFNLFLQKWMPILTPLSLILGVLLKDIGHQLLFLIPLIFAFMTFASSLNMTFGDVKGVRKHPKLILMSIAFLHILMPIWAYFYPLLFLMIIY